MVSWQFHQLLPNEKKRAGEGRFETKPSGCFREVFYFSSGSRRGSGDAPSCFMEAASRKESPVPAVITIWSGTVNWGRTNTPPGEKSAGFTLCTWPTRSSIKPGSNPSFRSEPGPGRQEGSSLTCVRDERRRSWSPTQGATIRGLFGVGRNAGLRGGRSKTKGKGKGRR